MLKKSPWINCTCHLDSFEKLTTKVTTLLQSEVAHVAVREVLTGSGQQVVCKVVYFFCRKGDHM